MSNINPVTEASVEATPLPPQPAVTNPVGTAAPILPGGRQAAEPGRSRVPVAIHSGLRPLRPEPHQGYGLEHAGTQIVTMALRRAQTTENSVLDYIPEGITLLPKHLRCAQRRGSRAYRPTGTRSVPHRLRQGRNRTRDQVPLAGQRRNHPSHRNAGQGRLRGHALHVSRTRLRPVSWRRPVPLPFMPLGSLIGSNMGLRMRDFIEISSSPTRMCRSSSTLVSAVRARPAMRWRWVRMR